MKRVRGTDVEVSRDATGGFVSVNWVCPYCGENIAGLYFSSRADLLAGDFELDQECESCKKMVTVECLDSVEMFGGIGRLLVN